MRFAFGDGEYIGMRTAAERFRVEYPRVIGAPHAGTRRRVQRGARARGTVRARVREVDRRLEAGDQAAVGVRARIRERRERRRVLQDATDVVHSELAHPAVAVAGGERLL